MTTLSSDMTFIYDGNKTIIDGLINFEKMHMIGNTIRYIRRARKEPFGEKGVRFGAFILF